GGGGGGGRHAGRPCRAVVCSNHAVSDPLRAPRTESLNCIGCWRRRRRRHRERRDEKTEAETGKGRQAHPAVASGEYVSLRAPSLGLCVSAACSEWPAWRCSRRGERGGLIRSGSARGSWVGREMSLLLSYTPL